MDLVTFTENLVKSIVHESDMVKVKEFTKDEDGTTILEIIVHESDMGAVIGRGGKMATALRTVIQAYAYTHHMPKININIDSF